MPNNPPKDNLKTLYTNLIDRGYKLPASYEQFRTDMQDKQNLNKLYSSLTEKGFKLPTDFDKFQSDMFGDGLKKKDIPYPAMVSEDQQMVPQVGTQKSQPTVADSGTGLQPDAFSQSLKANLPKFKELTGLDDGKLHRLSYLANAIYQEEQGRDGVIDKTLKGVIDPGVVDDTAAALKMLLPYGDPKQQERSYGLINMKPSEIPAALKGIDPKDLNKPETASLALLLKLAELDKLAEGIDDPAMRNDAIVTAYNQGGDYIKRLYENRVKNGGNPLAPPYQTDSYAKSVLGRLPSPVDIGQDVKGNDKTEDPAGFFDSAFQSARDFVTKQLPAYTLSSGAIGTSKNFGEPSTTEWMNPGLLGSNLTRLIGDEVFSGNEKYDNAKKVSEKVNKNIKAELVGEAITMLQKQNPGDKRIVQDIGEAFEDFDKFKSFAGGALGQTVPQIGLSLLTRGQSSFGISTTAAYLEQIQEIAKRNGITPEEVIMQDLQSENTALATGVFMGALDAIGAKGTVVLPKAIQSQLKKVLANRAIATLGGVTGEGLTEYLQSNIEQAGTNIGAGDNIEEAVAKIDQRKALSEGAAGVIGGAGFSAVSALTDNKTSKGSKQEQFIEQEKKRIEEIAKADDIAPEQVQAEVEQVQADPKKYAKEQLEVAESLQGEVTGKEAEYNQKRIESLKEIVGEAPKGKVDKKQLKFTQEAIKQDEEILKELIAENEGDKKKFFEDTLELLQKNPLKHWEQRLKEAKKNQKLAQKAGENEIVETYNSRIKEYEGYISTLKNAGEEEVTKEVTESVTKEEDVQPEVEETVPTAEDNRGTEPDVVEDVKEEPVAEGVSEQSDKGVEGVSSQKEPVHKKRTEKKSEQPKVETVPEKVTFNFNGIDTVTGKVIKTSTDTDGSTVYEVEADRYGRKVKYQVRKEDFVDESDPYATQVAIVDPLKNMGLSVSIPFDLPLAAAKNTIIKGYEKWIRPRSTMPKQMFDSYIESHSSINAKATKMKYQIADVKRAIEKEYGKGNKKAFSDINEALKGNIDVSNFSPEVADQITKMRQDIDRLSEELIASGAVSGKMEIKFNENLGIYLNRSYRSKDTPEAWRKFIEKTPEGQIIRNRAESFLRKQLPKAKPEEVNGIIDEILDSDDAPMSILSKGKLGSKDLSVLKKRKDIAPEIRALMGEYTDPLVNYARSYMKMTNLLAKHKFLTEIGKQGKGKYILDKPTEGFHKKIASEGSDTMNPLNGKYTTPEIAEVINNFNASTPTPKWLATYMKANGLVKYGKTALSPQTHARNLVGNLFIMMANGHYRFDKIGKAASIVFNDLAKLDKKDFREKMEEYAKLGVTFDTASAGELYAVIKDANEDIDMMVDIMDNKFERARKKAFDAVGKVYQSEDDLFKIAGYENELARYKDAYKNNPTYVQNGKPTEELKKKVAEIIRNTYPTYSLTPRLVKAIRRFPFLGSFVSFPSEIIRTSWNIMDQGVKEIKSKDTKAIGIQRLAGLGTSFIASYALSQYLLNEVGGDDEDDEAVEQFVAPWGKNGQRAYTKIDKETGLVQFVNVSYTDPYSYVKKPFNAMFDVANGTKTPEEAAIESVREFFEPFLGEDILTARILDIARNKQEANGKPVYNEAAPLGDIAVAMMNHVGDVIKPGFIVNGERIYKATTGYENEYGKVYNLWEEIVANTTGQRVETIDIAQAYGFRIYGTRKDIAEAEYIYNSIKNKVKTTTSEEREEERIKAQKAVDKVIKQAQKEYQAAIQLGVPPEKLNRIMRDRGLSTKYRLAIRGLREVPKVD